MESEEMQDREPEKEESGGQQPTEQETKEGSRGKFKEKVSKALKAAGTLLVNLFFAPAGVPKDNSGSAAALKKPRKRIRAVCVIFLVLLVLITFYYGFLMVARGEKYSKEAYEAQNRVFETKARRGNIYDALGNALAVTTDAYTVSVSREDIKDYGENKYADGDVDDYRRKVANGISVRTGVDEEWIFKELQSETGNHKNVAVNIDVARGEAVKAWISEEKIKGVTVTATTSRYYPYGSLAAHLIGFTGVDNTGLVCGMEVEFNDELAGTNGKILATVEKNGNAITGEPREVIQELENGVNVNLTIDKNIQQIAEDVLAECVRDYGVLEGGAAIVMDPKNADVLAMASYPSFDLNDPMTVLPKLRENSLFVETEESGFLDGFIWKNRAIASSYEPGSTFKAITSSVALEEGVVHPDDVISDDPLSLAGWTIHCSTAPGGNGHGEELFRLAVANSCNPVMARVALATGIDKFYSYVRAFGFYNKTNIKLSGEQVGVLHTQPTSIDLAVMAFGQRFTITPIQLATAYCAIANGGTLYEPRIVSSLTDENGRVVKSFPSNAVRNVISANTSSTVLELLEGVVAEGTGGRAYVAGYRVAGKTGTSETVDTETTGRLIVSFAAIAPSDNPEVVVLVMLDHPTIGEVAGSIMGAWAAGKIVKKVLEYKHVEKVYTEVDAARIRNVYYVDDLTGMPFVEAMNKLKNSSRLINTVIVGDPETHPEVVRQYPEAKVYTARECTQVLYFTDDPDAKADYVVVPNVIGMDICHAHNAVTSVELNMDCRKGDVIKTQSIEPGTLVEKGTVIVMTAGPREEEPQE
ncbi:MAG: peptidoglycan glycosyltransferase [Clostridia bacterium]|nr:peptidoglycan glycosyltransferase [Clostridia bacterium]